MDLSERFMMIYQLFWVEPQREPSREPWLSVCVRLGRNTFIYLAFLSEQTRSILVLLLSWKLQKTNHAASHLSTLWLSVFISLSFLQECFDQKHSDLHPITIQLHKTLLINQLCWLCEQVESVKQHTEPHSALISSSIISPTHWRRLHEQRHSEKSGYVSNQMGFSSQMSELILFLITSNETVENWQKEHSRI